MDIDAQTRKKNRIKKLKVHLIISLLTLALILFSMVAKRMKTRTDPSIKQPPVISIKK